MSSLRLPLALLAISALLSLSVSGAPPSAAPLFQSWWANQTATEVQSDGTQTVIGVVSWQQDDKWSRTSWFGSDGQNYVADFTNQITYYIDYYGVCQYTCAMESDTACDSQLNANSLCTFDQTNKSVYVDAPKLHGVPTFHYYWNDDDMASHELWVDQTKLLPLELFANYHPFGSWSSNLTFAFTNFVNGVPPASNFKFTNEEYCYPGDDDQCSNLRGIIKATMPPMKRPKIILTEQ